jgi:predicted dithiol-disulfide oxidoreductase (DUF899 family)
MQLTEPKTDLEKEIRAIENDITEKKKSLADLRKKIKPRPIEDFVFEENNGAAIKLSELFGDSNESDFSK